MPTSKWHGLNHLVDPSWQVGSIAYVGPALFRSSHRCLRKITGLRQESCKELWQIRFQKKLKNQSGTNILEEIWMNKVETSVVFVWLEKPKPYKYLQEKQVLSYSFKRHSSVSLTWNSRAPRGEKYLITFWHCAQRLERMAWHHLSTSWLSIWAVSTSKTVASMPEK